ncbi:MAG: hypothetical protein JWN79_1473 [Gemmatimonadetes bacterium]|jgi:four helix bundle protein|nr:hypothetical protein [Gemmatimonadota bacterium]
MTQPTYQEWEASVPASERSDALWRMEAYRLSRYLIPQARDDARILHALPLGRPLMSQMWRAAGSIPANIAEGYSRGTGADRARFYEYALGSTRECVVWYEAAREILPDDLVSRRVEELVRVKKLLLTALPHTRRDDIRR